MEIYLSGISAFMEGEDVVLRWVLVENGRIIEKKEKVRDYVKPYLADFFALAEVIQDLKKRNQENDLRIFINNSLMEELIRGVGQTGKKDAVRMAEKLRDDLNKLPQDITLIDVNKDKTRQGLWQQNLGFSKK